MAIDTANGIIASQPPRMVYTTDSRAGCPGAAVAGPYGGSSTLISQTISLISSSLLWITARCIYNYSGRCDMSIYVDNVYCGANSLNWVYNNGTYQWEENWLCHTATLSAGTHYIELREITGGTCNSRFGCGTDWGEISTLIWEK
jgi:hypothetical protein